MNIKTIIVGSLLFFNIIVLWSQDNEPIPLPPFTEAEPLWTYRPEWEEHLGRPLKNNEYYSITFTMIREFNQNVYIGTQNFYINPDTSYFFKIIDGIGLHSFNLMTGEPIWSDIYNKSNGAESFITLNPQNVRIDEDKVTIVGNRSNQEQYISNYFYAYKREYDTESGELLSYEYDEKDSTILENKYSSHYGLYMPNPEGEGYIHFYCGYYGFGPSTKFRMVFQWLSETMDSTNGIIKEIIHEPIPIPHSFLYYNGYQYRLLNDTTVLVLIPTKDKDDVYKSTVELLWVDVSDLNNIHIKKQKRLDDYALFNRFNYNSLVLRPHNGDIYITDYYLDTTAFKFYTYLLHLDSDGEVVSYVKDIKIEDHHYGRINNILYIDEGNDKVYLDVLDSKTGLSGSDIISVSSTGDVNFETSITTGHGLDEDGRTYYVGQHGMITDEGILVLPRKVSRVVDIGTFWTSYIVAWDVRDFGMEWNPSATTVVEEPEVTIDVKLFPNPTAGQIEIDVSHSLSEELRIELYDIAGRKLEHITMVNEDSTVNFNLSPYASGSYFIQIYNEKGELLKKKKVIKL